MSNLSANHSTIAFHISDRTLTPLLSSSQQSQQHVSHSDGSGSQTQALHALTTASINAYETARRLGYGAMQRLMIETTNNGPVLLQSYMNPSSVIPRGLISDVEITDGHMNDLLDVGRPSTGISEQTTSSELANSEQLLHLTNGFDTNHGPLMDENSGDESSAIQPPPTLFATVVVPRRSELGGGRTVAMRMERLGRQFQREWVREQVAGQTLQDPVAEEEVDG